MRSKDNWFGKSARIISAGGGGRLHAQVQGTELLMILHRSSDGAQKPLSILSLLVSQVLLPQPRLPPASQERHKRSMVKLGRTLK